MLNSKSAMSFDQQAMADNQMGFVESRKINSIFVNQPLQQQQQPQQQQQHHQVPSRLLRHLIRRKQLQIRSLLQ